MVRAGQVFGRLTVITQSTKWPERWLCRCVCETTRIVRARDLVAGLIDSCGCWAREIWKEWRKTFVPRGHQHDADGGASATRCSWVSMISRCGNPNATGYQIYGGSGVKVCSRWLGQDGFQNFVADMGERPPGTSISRILDTGNYTRLNCKWDSKAGQTAEKMGKRAMIRFRAARAKGKLQ
jgi:hypothetical protein